VNTEIEVDQNGAVVHFRSEVTLEAVEAAVAALRQHPDFRPDLPTIWDFSGARGGGLDPDQMRRLARSAGDHRRGGGRPRVAVVVPEQSNFGGARMFSSLGADAIHVELGIFRESATAYAWVFGHGDGPPIEDSA
jgi:hypothetical protein